MPAKYPNDSRVVFEQGFQRNIFNTIDEVYGNEWSLKVSDILKLSRHYVYNLRDEIYRLSPHQLEILINNFKFLEDLEIGNRIIKIESSTEMHRRAGRLGGNKGGPALMQRYPNRLKKMAPVGGRATLAKYGKEYFKNLAEKYGSAGGLAASEKASPTKQMKRFVKENNSLGLIIGADFKVNETIDLDKLKRNIDFTYYSNGKLIAIEEVTDTIPYRKAILPRVVEILELRNLLPKDIGILFTIKGNKQAYNGYDIRIDPAIMLHLIDNNVIPIIDDNKNRGKIIDRLNTHSFKKYLAALRETFRRDLNSRVNRINNNVKAQTKVPMNKSEKDIHNLLENLNMKPKGKTIIEGMYGTMTEVDNRIDVNDKTYLIMITECRSGLKEVLTSHVKQHTGQAYFLKNLCYQNAEIISIILSKHRDIGNSLWAHRLKEYAKVFADIKEFETFLKSDLSSL